MGVLRSGLRRVAEVVARRVARNDLFEKPGERARTEPLPPRAPPPAPEPAAPEPAAPEPAAQEPAAQEPAVKEAPAEEAPAKKAPAKKPGAKKAPAKKPGAKKAPAKKPGAKRASAGSSEGEPSGPPLPAAGCVKAGLDLVRAAHQPGPRPRIVNHWATWCVPCIDELPLLVDLSTRLGGEVDFLGVSWDLFDPRGDEDDIVEHVARFADGNGLRWGSLLVTAPPEAFFEALGISWQKIPQTWIIGTDGRVLARYDGAVEAAQCAEIEALLGGGAA